MTKMTLKELNDLVDRIDTFGLKPEEVIVEFRHGATELKINKADACVSAMPGVAKPVLTITLGSVYLNNGYMDR